MTQIPLFLLKDWQAAPLEKKIEKTKLRIEQFYKHMDGMIYVATSGGKDSDVLLHLVRSLYPDTEAVHIATPRYPETVEKMKNVENLTTLTPSMTFKEIVEEYGYPVISKETSKNISRYRNTKSEAVKKYRKYGIKKDGTIGKVGVIAEKWHYLLDAPFKISDKCCDIMKKIPFQIYEKESEKKPLIGILAEESRRRTMNYLKTGCNVLKEGKEQSYPIAFWTDRDIWKYIRDNEIEYSKIYDKGEASTGCVFCMFGCHLEKQPNRFQRMYHQHLKLYNYCMKDLGLKEILKYLKVSITPLPQQQTLVPLKNHTVYRK